LHKLKNAHLYERVVKSSIFVSLMTLTNLLLWFKLGTLRKDSSGFQSHFIPHSLSYQILYQVVMVDRLLASVLKIYRSNKIISLYPHGLFQFLLGENVKIKDELNSMICPRQLS